jgi:hypothetical protein
MVPIGDLKNCEAWYIYRLSGIWTYKATSWRRCACALARDSLSAFPQVGQNAIGDEGAFAIAASTVQSVWLAGNGAGQEAMQALRLLNDRHRLEVRW